MFIQPITFAQAGISKLNVRRSPQFKGVEELDAYMNYRGPEPPEIEKVKYQLTVDAVYYEGKGDFARAAEAKMRNAQICLNQGLKDDAEKLIKTATEYISRLHR